MSRFANTGLKVGCFAGFCHHHVTITSAYMHAYRYPLFESGTKIIALCRKDIKLKCKYKE